MKHITTLHTILSRTLLFVVAMLSSLSLMARKEPTPVYIVAGQSNTDGRVPNKELPSYIQQNKYQHCYWSYGSGVHSGNGDFEKFWPRIYNEKLPGRWAYDAVTYYWLEQSWKRDFYVIKESLGGTAIDTKARSNSDMYWSADKKYLDSTTASDKGGKSLLKAFTENIGACIDKHLSKLKGGYEIKAFIWHQGESDRQVSRYYERNMRGVIEYVRNYLVRKTGNKRYAHLPVIMGSIPHAGRGYAHGVEEAQIALTKEDPDIYLVDVHDATLRNDNIHFDAAGAELLGKKVYNQLVTLGLAGKGARTVPFVQKSKRYELPGGAYMFANFPDSFKANRRAVIACPGGAYAHLSMADEGTNWANLFNDKDVVYFTLMYRMPKGDRSVPVSDATNAIKMVRDSAKVWGINPHAVGIMGSSAGGHLASTMATHGDSASRPDFQILFYPVITMGQGCHQGSRDNFLGKDATNPEIVKEFSNELQVKEGVTPPALILLANDDTGVPPAYNGVAYYQALTKNHIPVALYVYPFGKHGFGFKKSFAFHDQLLVDIGSWLDNLKLN
ncbi:MAG: sialate O-acetylesterase [Prevotella sp.]|jgi:acetyl esterase/lipase